MSTSLSFLHWRKHICSSELSDFSSTSLRTELGRTVCLVCFYQFKICPFNDPLSLVTSNSHKDKPERVWGQHLPVSSSHWPSQNISEELACLKQLKVMDFPTLFYEWSEYFPSRTWKCRGETEGSSDTNPKVSISKKTPEISWVRRLDWSLRSLPTRYILWFCGLPWRMNLKHLSTKPCHYCWFCAPGTFIFPQQVPGRNFNTSH